MPRRGPSKTPTAVLKARGSWRAKEREKEGGEPEVEPLEDFPPAPERLSAAGRQIWNDVVPKIQRMRILSESDLNSLAVYCDLHDLYWNGGDKLKIAPQLRNYAREFGLTPSARASVKVLDGKAKKQESKEDKYFKALKVAK